MATRAYQRAALKELHAMKGSRAHEYAAVGARLQRLCMLCHVAAYAHKVCELCRVLHVVVQATNVSEV